MPAGRMRRIVALVAVWMSSVLSLADLDPASSLVAAIERANSGEASHYALAADLILSEPLPPITGALTIEGDGHWISGDERFQVFVVAGGSLRLRDMALVKAKGTGSGGAILVLANSELVASGVDFKENWAGHGAAIATEGSGAKVTVSESAFRFGYAGTGGGAVFVYGGEVEIRDSSFLYNVARSYGGAIETLLGSVSIENSTFSGNQARDGGALHNSGELTLTHLTLMDNQAWGRGEGVYKRTGIVKLRNSFIDAGQSEVVDCAGGLDESVGNLSVDGSCGPMPRGLPRLGVLSGHLWRQLEHHPPRKGSPAIDAADPAFCLETDQLGRARPRGAGCDVGAIESGFAAETAADGAFANCEATATHGLNFRASPSLDGQRIGVVSLGKTLVALEKSDRWLKVIHGDAAGWIGADFVRLAGDCG